MGKLLYAFVWLMLASNSMNAQIKKTTAEQSKDEVLDAETIFAKMAKEKGIHSAFMAFAADDAVLSRNNELIKGKKAIDLFYKGQGSKGLAWTVEFVDVSAAGDLGYTYGHYSFTHLDKEGKVVESSGIFHTVWKKIGGSWKFVWD